MNYTCSLELKLWYDNQYMVTLYYKRHWYNIYNNCILKLLCDNYELNKFIGDSNMENIIKLIKDKLKEVDNDYNEMCEINLKIEKFNDKFNKIKVKL